MNLTWPTICIARYLAENPNGYKTIRATAELSGQSFWSTGNAFRRFVGKGWMEREEHHYLLTAPGLEALRDYLRRASGEQRFLSVTAADATPRTVFGRRTVEGIVVTMPTLLIARHLADNPDGRKTPKETSRATGQILATARSVMLTFRKKGWLAQDPPGTRFDRPGGSRRLFFLVTEEGREGIARFVQQAERQAKPGR